MTTDEARKWLILASLIITGVQVVFLFVAPVIGYPLEFPKNLDLLQIVSPVFMGYLGSAVHFIFMSPAPKVTVNNGYLGMLIKGPIIIYACAMTAAFAAFGYSNRQGAAVGNGMTTDNLATSMAIALGILAVTTGVIVSYLFTASRPSDVGADPVPDGKQA